MTFGTSIPDTAGHQMALQVPISPTSVSTLPGEIRTNEILHFIQVSIIT